MSIVVKRKIKVVAVFIENVSIVAKMVTGHLNAAPLSRKEPQHLQQQLLCHLLQLLCWDSSPVESHMIMVKMVTGHLNAAPLSRKELQHLQQQLLCRLLQLLCRVSSPVESRMIMVLHEYHS
jgi:transcription antitermination factor NusG